MKEVQTKQLTGNKIMNKELKNEIVRLVNEKGEKAVINAIQDHNYSERLTPYIVTKDNAHLFRSYRNAVSSNVVELVSIATEAQQVK